MPCGDPQNNRQHHIHAAFTQRDQSGGIVYVWGENSNLKSYNFSTMSGILPTFRAEGDELASFNLTSSGGMPGAVCSWFQGNHRRLPAFHMPLILAQRLFRPCTQNMATQIKVLRKANPSPMTQPLFSRATN
ncbi:MAG: hypothetical protein ACU88J_10990 [Gammaproteobacteria bacterium]